MLDQGLNTVNPLNRLFGSNAELLRSKEYCLRLYSTEDFRKVRKLFKESLIE